MLNDEPQSWGAEAKEPSCLSQLMLITELMRQEVYKVSFFQTASHCLVMVTHRYLGVVILAVFATTVTNAGILSWKNVNTFHNMGRNH